MGAGLCLLQRYFPTIIGLLNDRITLLLEPFRVNTVLIVPDYFVSLFSEVNNIYRAFIWKFDMLVIIYAIRFMLH